MKTTLLVVEDDEAILHLIDVALTMNYYKVVTAKTGKEADFRLRTEQPDIILLDLGLPDIDGLSLIQQFRDFVDTPIIVISARTEEQTIVEALDRGANDYMTKPFNIDELRARIRVALRMSRSTETIQSRFTNGPLTIDFDAKSVLVNEQSVHLTPNEFQPNDIKPSCRQSINLSSVIKITLWLCQSYRNGCLTCAYGLFT